MIILVILGISLFLAIIFIIAWRARVSNIVTDSSSVKDLIPIFEKNIEESDYVKPLIEGRSREQKVEKSEVQLKVQQEEELLESKSEVTSDFKKKEKQNEDQRETKQTCAGHDIEEYIEQCRKNTIQDRKNIEEQDRKMKNFDEQTERDRKDLEKQKRKIKEQFERLDRVSEKVFNILKGAGFKPFVLNDSKSNSTNSFPGLGRNIPEIGEEFPFK